MDIPKATNFIRIFCVLSSIVLKLFPKGIEFGLELFDTVWKIGDHDVLSILRSSTVFV
jgi:hypothetical protein